MKEFGIELPTPPEPFGIYAEAVQTGNLLFLTGMLPTVGREAKFIGRIGAELDVQTGRNAAYLAALNALAVAQQHLGSLDKVTRAARPAPEANVAAVLAFYILNGALPLGDQAPFHNTGLFVCADS